MLKFSSLPLELNDLANFSADQKGRVRPYSTGLRSLAGYFTPVLSGD